jgi:chemotaxis protein histidine kinase CheA
MQKSSRCAPRCRCLRSRRPPAALFCQGVAAEGKNEAADAGASRGRRPARCPVNNANHASAAAELAPAPATAAPSGPDNLLRVDAEKIDSVLNLVGELILAKSMLQQALLEFGNASQKRSCGESLPTPWRFKGGS